MAPDPREETGSRRQLPPEAQIKLRFEKFSSFVEEYSSNISLGGMFVKTHKPRPVGAEIVFEFKLVDGFRLIHGQGDVVWVRPKDNGAENPAGMGVRFKALDESGRQLVLKLLEEQVKSGGAPFDVDEIPADAHDQPVAGEQMSLIDISEDPTLVGATVAETPGREELGFDAPWGDKLPEIPTELLDGDTSASEPAASEPAASEPSAAASAAIAAAKAAKAAKAAEAASAVPAEASAPTEQAAVATGGIVDDGTFESEVARATESMGFQTVESADANAVEDPVVQFEAPVAAEPSTVSAASESGAPETSESDAAPSVEPVEQAALPLTTEGGA